MKTTEELNTLKEKFDTADKKLSKLTEKELAQVSGGMLYNPIVLVTPVGETISASFCPHCLKTVHGTVEQVNAHIAACQG